MYPVTTLPLFTVTIELASGHCHIVEGLELADAIELNDAMLLAGFGVNVAFDLS